MPLLIFPSIFKWQKTVELEVWSSTDSSLVVVDGFDSTTVRNFSGSINNGLPVRTLFFMA